MNWATKRLDELGRIVTGKTPATVNPNFYDGEFMFVRPSDLAYMSYYVSTTDATVTGEAYDSHKNQFIPKDSVMFTCIGNTIGKCGISSDECLTNQQINSIVVNEDNSPKYIYYMLNIYRPLIRGIGLSGGAAQPIINKRTFSSVKVRVPDKITQESIADILSAYDDLIANNRRRIALLGEAARLLYREWFIHFRFPGHEHVEVIDGFPDGWKRLKMEQILTTLESGGRPRGGALENYGIPSIGAENVIALGQYDYTKEKYIPRDYFARLRRGVIQSRDVLLYKDGANIGRSSMFGDRFPHSQCAVNEHVFILRTYANVGQSFLYFWLSQPETRQSVVNLNASTAQPGISQGKLKTLWFLLPPEALRHQFNESVEAHVAQIFRLALMNRKLAEARDLLLPRLTSGAITI